MERSDRRNSNNTIDVSSISPPAVQFAIGTPPPSRRRSTTGSLSETPPAPNVWHLASGANASPIRRSNNSSPVLPSTLPTQLMKLPALGSPHMITDNNNLPAHHILGPRAFTLPEMGSTQTTYNTNVLERNNSDELLFSFHAPELPAETLLDSEHNETLAKLNFVLALSDCILDVANMRCSVLSALMNEKAPQLGPHPPENCRRVERLVLLVR